MATEEKQTMCSSCELEYFPFELAHCQVCKEKVCKENCFNSKTGFCKDCYSVQECSNCKNLVRESEITYCDECLADRYCNNCIKGKYNSQEKMCELCSETPPEIRLYNRRRAFRNFKKQKEENERRSKFLTLFESSVTNGTEKGEMIETVFRKLGLSTKKTCLQQIVQALDAFLLNKDDALVLAKLISPILNVSRRFVERLLTEAKLSQLKNKNNQLIQEFLDQMKKLNEAQWQIDIRVSKEGTACHCFIYPPNKAAEIFIQMEDKFRNRYCGEYTMGARGGRTESFARLFCFFENLSSEDRETFFNHITDEQNFAETEQAIDYCWLPLITHIIYEERETIEKMLDEAEEDLIDHEIYDYLLKKLKKLPRIHLEFKDKKECKITFDGDTPKASPNTVRKLEKKRRSPEVLTPENKRLKTL